MEWEPVFILGVMGGAMLISAVRGVIDTQGRARFGITPAVAVSRQSMPARPADALGRSEPASEIGDLRDRIAVLEWLAAPAARTGDDENRLRRGAA
jgi:hypothetical protein